MSWSNVVVIGVFVLGAVFAGIFVPDKGLAASLVTAAAALALPANRGPNGPDGAPGEVTNVIRRALPAVAALVGYGAAQLATAHGPLLAQLVHGRG